MCCRQFFELVKSIGESRSKQEEDKIIVNEVHTLKQKMVSSTGGVGQRGHPRYSDSAHSVHVCVALCPPGWS